MCCLCVEGEQPGMVEGRVNIVARYFTSCSPVFVLCNV